MAKRKHNNVETASETASNQSSKKQKPSLTGPVSASQPFTIQIITGSYDRVLHGVTATIDTVNNECEFADSFLFNAHTSAIRCLAISPPSAPVPGQSQKIILASGSTDERVNLYHLSAHPPRRNDRPKLPSLTSKNVAENPQNRELGSLTHHASTVTALHFPTRSKLLSSAEDCTIAVTRTRDWSLLSTIKAPVPKAQGRPSGDTAPLGGTPAGVNDFAVHPSLKLMISVGKGERCMRLWNLVTGKKAGVLNFSRDMLMDVGESKFSSGEGRKVAWGNTKGGEEFCVGFEYGVLVFGMDSKPRCRVVLQRKTKIHQIRYIQTSADAESGVMAISTEDGRILFFSTLPDHLVQSKAVEGKEPGLPSAKLIGQLGGKEAGVPGRIKDFVVLQVHSNDPEVWIVTASSDGAIRLWKLELADVVSSAGDEVKQVGEPMAMCETGNRITCLQAFVMIPGNADAETAAEEVIVEDVPAVDGSSSDSE